MFLLALLGSVSAPGGRPPRAYANVKLVRFTATSLTGLPEVYINWETATEIDTAGFYVQRSQTSLDGPYARVSPRQAPEGDSVTGAVYDWIDETTTLNTTYYYRLEETLTNAAAQPNTYPPVSVIAGVAPTQVSAASSTPTQTPTPTPTPTLTQTPTPTRTPTTRPSTVPTNTPVPTNPPVVTATPHLATGATITPRPTTANVVVVPTSISVATQVVAAPTVQLPSPLPATALPNNGHPAPTLPDHVATQMPNPAAPPNEVAAAPAAAPVLAPTQIAPEAVEPVVVVTEAATPAAKPAESRGGGLLLIIGAAIFLLVGAYLMLRQASQ